MANHMIVVVGDPILDVYFEGSAGRISKEAPCPIVNVYAIQEIPGGAGNVAMNVSALGNKTHFVTIGGEGDEGALGISEVIEECPFEIDITTITDEDFKTPIKHRVVDDNGRQVVRFDCERYYESNKETNKQLVDKVIRLMNRYDDTDPVRCLVLSDYAKGIFLDESVLLELLGEARRLKIPTIIGAKYGPITKYCPATLVVMNIEEAYDMLDDKNVEPEEVASTLLEQVYNKGTQAIYITAGEDGGYLAYSDGGKIKVETIGAYPPREVFDPVGAGDTVVAILAHELQCKPEEYANISSRLEEACRRASMGAGVAVMYPGTIVLMLSAYEEALAKNGRITKLKYCKLDELVETALDMRLQGKKVVLTNGCFDGLHPGHLHLLQQARKKGDMLIVAINSDVSIKAIKGNDRPFISEAHRISMLEALECVDAVITFDEETPYNIIESILPNVLVKGEEYKDKGPIIGADVVLENDGKVEFVKMLPGYSSTTLFSKNK
jgi:D-beta-D-heptose 7-phosphate kinase/D-beta-D-heptose 1-phosphate adenosyltransferase